jgi:hypothetical protein
MGKLLFGERSERKRHRKHGKWGEKKRGDMVAAKCK